MNRIGIIFAAAMACSASAWALSPSPARPAAALAAAPTALASIVEANSLPDQDVDSPGRPDDQPGQAESDPADRRPRTIAVVIMAVISLLAVGIIWRMVRTVLQGRQEAGRSDGERQP